MKIQLFLCLFSTISLLINGLKPKDLCVSTNNKCNDMYSFSCHKYCTVDKLTCEKFMKNSNQLNSLAIQKTKLAIDQLFSYYKLNHENLIKNIQQCSNNLEEICLNKQKCIKSFKSKESLKDKGNSTVNCPCANNYPYNCGNNYCASSRASCESINTDTVYNLCKVYYRPKLNLFKNFRY